MRTYKDKEELKAEISKGFEKYIAEFDSIPEALKDIRVAEVDRTPAENLAYQIGWTTLLLKWENDEKRGVEVKTPSELFRWNQLGDLYQWFTDTKRPPTFSVDGLDNDMDFQALRRKWSAPADGFRCKVRWDRRASVARGAAPCSEQSDAKQPGHSNVRAVCFRRTHILPSGEYRSAPFVPKG